MSDIVKKMGDQMPERLFWFQIFLAANMTKTSMYDGAAV